MTYPWPTLMPMGIVVISCVRLSIQPSMGLGLCIAYKALGRNGLQFGMLMYPDGLHSAFMDAYGYCCWSVCPSICPFVRFRWLCICWQITWNKWHKIWHDDVVIIGRWLLPSLVDTGDICCHYWQLILVWEWCSWSSANRRCSNYIWVINNCIAYWGATYIIGLSVTAWRWWGWFCFVLH